MEIVTIIIVILGIALLQVIVRSAIDNSKTMTEIRDILKDIRDSKDNINIKLPAKTDIEEKETIKDTAKSKEKVICKNCNAKNSGRRTNCYMCGKEL